MIFYVASTLVSPTMASHKNVNWIAISIIDQLQSQYTKAVSIYPNSDNNCLQDTFLKFKSYKLIFHYQFHEFFFHISDRFEYIASATVVYTNNHYQYSEIKSFQGLILLFCRYLALDICKRT